MFRTDDPIADFDRYDAEQQKQLEKLPVCVECDNPITTKKLYLINDEFVCPQCLKDYHEKSVDDFID